MLAQSQTRMYLRVVGCVRSLRTVSRYLGRCGHWCVAEVIMRICDLALTTMTFEVIRWRPHHRECAAVVYSAEMVRASLKEGSRLQSGTVPVDGVRPDLPLAPDCTLTKGMCAAKKITTSGISTFILAVSI